MVLAFQLQHAGMPIIQVQAVSTELQGAATPMQLLDCVGLQELLLTGQARLCWTLLPGTKTLKARSSEDISSEGSLTCTSMLLWTKKAPLGELLAKCGDGGGLVKPLCCQSTAKC